MVNQKRLEKINDLIIEEINELKLSYQNSPPKIDLMRIPFNHEEITEAVESLLSTYVTMGDKVKKFEDLWSKYIGSKNTIMVNSGSSANLLALSALSSPEVQNPITKGSEIITPALTWSTTVFPIANIGAIPKLVDVNKEDFIMDIEVIKEAINSNTSAIMPVHLLGNPVDMPAIMDLAEDNNLWVIEDSCEAHGAKIGNKKIGSFGHVSTFSFFFSHHITTIEGGAVLTNDLEIANLLKSYRAHGWIRERSDNISIQNNFTDIDPRFLFITQGYNFRPTEIQGAFGMHQVGKLDEYVKRRSEIVNYWISGLQEYSDYFYLPKERKGTTHAWFGFPLLLKPNTPFDRKELSDFLEKNNITTRPIMGGNITRQPAMKNIEYSIHEEINEADYIMDNGIFIGNHQDLREQDMQLLLEVINKFSQQFV